MLHKFRETKSQTYSHFTPLDLPLDLYKLTVEIHIKPNNYACKLCSIYITVSLRRILWKSIIVVATSDWVEVLLIVRLISMSNPMVNNAGGTKKE